MANPAALARVSIAYPVIVESKRFTAKERDAESGLDYFGARYYGSALGRFTSPDTPFLAQHPAEPQSWNLYTYTASNPLSRIDPDGRNWFNINGTWQWHAGSDVDNNGDSCEKGTKGCNHSNYTHLIVFQKTGTNKEGAAVGTLTLYGNDKGKAILTDTVFSGGNGALAAANGTYRIRLEFSTLTSNDILTQIGQGGQRYGVLKPNYGVQDLPVSVAGRDDPWGTIRARLNETIPDGPDNGRFLYLHGSLDAHDCTSGCVSERNEKVLRWIRDAAKNKAPGVFPRIPVLVR